jgi:hypothetical protein
MPIVAPTPTNVPASDAKVYDKYWLKHFVIMANDPSKKVIVTAILHKAREENGEWELSPVDSDVVVRVNDFDAAATVDPTLATIKESLLAKIQEVAVAQGKI